MIVSILIACQNRGKFEWFFFNLVPYPTCLSSWLNHHKDLDVGILAIRNMSESWDVLYYYGPTLHCHGDDMLYV